MDIGLNEQFDITLGPDNDLRTVSGREEFEQTIALHTTAYFHNLIGDVHRDNVLSLLEVEARRVIQNNALIEDMPEFKAEFDDDQPGLVIATILYQTGETVTFPITE